MDAATRHEYLDHVLSDVITNSGIFRYQRSTNDYSPYGMRRGLQPSRNS